MLLLHDYKHHIYNQLIESGGLVLPYAIPEMSGMGTPEELEKYLKKTKEQQL